MLGYLYNFFFSHPKNEGEKLQYDAQTEEGETFDDDEVFPVHFIDQGAIIRTSIINYTFRYNNVLDADKLHSSLVKLLTTQGEWRKFGGRLRLNKHNKLEIHVPNPFTATRPPIRYTHTKLDVPVDEDPLASRLPKETGDQPSIQEGCHTFRPFSQPPGLPNNIEHYLKTDEPLISLCITSFTDATLVAITFPHSAADAMATASLLKAWSAVLAGRMEDVSPVEGAREDVLNCVGTESASAANATYVMQDKQLKGLSMLIFAVRYIWDQLTRRNIQARTIYLPAKFMSHLRQKIEEDLTPPDSSQAPPFVSDNDIISAWGAQMILTSLNPPPRRHRPAIICNVFDLRSRLHHNTFVPGAAYLQNLILPSTTHLLPEPNPDPDPNATATALTSSTSISRTALQIRHALRTQSTDPQIRNLLRILRSTGTTPLFGSSDSVVIAITNWSKARFLEVADFAPAVVVVPHGGEESEPESETTTTPTLPGLPISYTGTTLSKTDNPRDTFIIYGKDSNKTENYWLHAYLRNETWEKIENEFEERRRQAEIEE